MIVVVHNVLNRVYIKYYVILIIIYNKLRNNNFTNKPI